MKLTDEQHRENTIAKWGLTASYKESGLSSTDYMKRCFEVEKMPVFRKRSKVISYKSF